ncbi:unnamed protein product, partial [Medioppia subpectinata]
MTALDVFADKYGHQMKTITVTTIFWGDEDFIAEADNKVLICFASTAMSSDEKPLITVSGNQSLVSDQLSQQITRDLPQEGVEWQRYVRP